MQKRRQALSDGVAEWDLPKKGLNNYTWEGWKESHPPTEEELAASKKKIKEIVSKKNVIRISNNEKKEKTREDNLPGLVFVWINDEGNVKEVYFNEDGMARLFNAGDLSTEEFAQLLVKNYSGIPSLEPEVKKENPGRGIIQETTWTHKDPRGYQVKLFERAYFDNNGVRYNAKTIERNAELALPLSLADKLPTRYFTVFAIKPESARKFD